MYLLLFTQILNFLITGFIILPSYKAVPFILLFLKRNHRYSDNLGGLYNFFFKSATFCPHNPFGISDRIALKISITMRKIYNFPVMSLPIQEHVVHLNLIKCYVSPSNKSTHFLHSFFHNELFAIAVMRGCFSYGSFWFVQYSAQSLA